jgi:hypothetical protein
VVMVNLDGFDPDERGFLTPRTGAATAR